MYSAAGCKGKGKGKGKSNGTKDGGKGHTLPRTRLSAEKFTGSVIAWKGKYGWIKPGEEIEHEKASLHNGSLFVGMNDIIGATSLEVGAPVEFHICEDDSGLGAEEVVQTGAAPPGAAAAAAAKGKASAKGGAVKGKDSSKGFSKGASGKDSWNSWGGKGCGAASWGGKGWTSPVATKGMDGGKWGGGKCNGGKFGKANGKGKDPNKGKGHLLPRTRISAEKFTGSVTDWKGKYGWIQPTEEIEHEKAAKHQGRLFVSKDDLEGGA